VNDLLGLVALFVLVALNGYFVASEFALVSVRKTRIDQMVNEGKAGAKAVQSIIKKLDLYIAATQLGITMASLAIGFVAEPAIEHLLAPLLHGYEFSESTIKTISFTVAFVISTVLHIIFGELAPKTLALQRSEQTSIAVATPLIIFTFLFKPIIMVLNWLGNLVVRLWGLKPDEHGHGSYSSAEIRMIVDSSGQAGVLEQQEKEILQNVFEFQDTLVKTIMVHRTEVEAIERGSSLRQLVKMKKTHGYSRVPIFEDNLDNIVGMVHTADALLYTEELDQVTVDDLLRPAFFVPENMKVGDLFTVFQKQKTHMVVVVDEFGGMSEEEEDIQHLGEKDYLVEADLHVDEVEQLLEIELDGKASGDFETIAGFIFSKLGYIPKMGEHVDSEGWRFEIQEASDRQIKKVRISAVPAPTEA
jgi:putative hemolysin